MVEEITVEEVLDDLGNATGQIIDGLGNVFDNLPGLPPLPGLPDLNIPEMVWIVAALIGGAVIGGVVVYAVKS